MENIRYLIDIDRLPGFVEKNGKLGNLSITRDGNEWIIRYSRFRELISTGLDFSIVLDDILEKIDNGNFEYRRY